MRAVSLLESYFPARPQDPKGEPTRRVLVTRCSTRTFHPFLQGSVEQDSDTDSELEEISLDEPSAHAQRWVTFQWTGLLDKC